MQQQTPLSQINNKCLDLPLIMQTKDKNQAHKSNRNMPRQLANDIYRVSIKEITENKVYDNTQVKTHKNEPLKTSPMYKRSSQNKKNQALRAMIKKKLTLNKENDQVSKLKENQKIKKSSSNRYQELLNQFYGEPNDFKNKERKTAEEQRSKTQSKLKRYQSAKSLKPLKTQQKSMRRMQSHNSLRKVANQPQTYYGASRGAQGPALPSYLDLYFQKRSPVLFL